MKPTDQTLLGQMRITDLEIEHRKALFNFSFDDVKVLQAVRPVIEQRIDELVARLYESPTSVPDIALLIGDADTLARLRNAQRRDVLGLLSGSYNLDYVNNRLRIGLVHKRIGVEPKLYLAAVHTLKLPVVDLLNEVRTVASALLRISRSTDCCFRYGGDEFFIILPNCREAEARTIYLERLTAELSRQKDAVAVSAGFVETGVTDYLSPEDLIREADGRMYAMKRGPAREAGPARPALTVRRRAAAELSSPAA